MPASETDFSTTLQETGSTIQAQWPAIVRAVQSLTAVFLAKVASGTEPADVLAGLAFGLDGQTTNHLDWRIYGDSGGDLLVQENTGTDASPTWTTRFSFTAGGAAFDLSAGADLNGAELILDADGDTSITADTDDRVDIRIGGTDLFRLLAAASAVNGLDFTASAAASAVTISAVGTDTNITINLVPKGSGTVQVGGVDVLVSGDAIANLVEDTTPQLGGMLDVNGNAIGDGTLELLTFVEDASAVNHVEIENEATGDGPIIRAAGDDTNVPLKLRGKGSGPVEIGDADLQFPDADGSNGQAIVTNGAGVLSFATGAGKRVLVDSATASVSATLDLDLTGTAYDIYIIELINVVPATDAQQLQMSVSNDGGSTFENDAATYAYNAAPWTNAALTVASSASTTIINLTGRSTVDSTAADGGVCGQIVAYRLRSATINSLFHWHLMYLESTSAFPEMVLGSAGVIDAAEDNDALRFAFASGNITSGTIRVWGLEAS